MFEQRLRRQLNRFGYRFFGDIAIPLFDNGFSCHPTGDLVEHIFNEDTSAQKRRLTVTNLRVSYDMASK